MRENILYYNIMPRGTYRYNSKGKSGEDSEDSEDSEDRKKIDVYMREARDDDTRERPRSRSPSKSHHGYGNFDKRSPSKSNHIYGPFDKIYHDLFIKIRTQRSFPKDHDSIVEHIKKEYKTIAEEKSLSIANTVLGIYGNDRTKHALYLEELVNHWLNSNEKPHFKGLNITLYEGEVEQLKQEILIILNTKIEEQIEIEKQKQQQQIDSIRTKFANLGRAEGVKAKYNNTYRRHKKTRRHHYKKTHRRRYRK
jgi:hypothetical protein